jgi:hypothetical protein
MEEAELTYDRKKQLLHNISTDTTTLSVAQPIFLNAYSSIRGNKEADSKGTDTRNLQLESQRLQSISINATTTIISTSRLNILAN